MIDFTCTGVSQTQLQKNLDPYSQHKVVDYGKNSQKLAEDVHYYATFYFNDGAEKIDFPVFKLNTGFSETSNDRPSFTVQGIVKSHTLLDNTVYIAKQVVGIHTQSNIPFQVKVDFANDSKTFRTLSFTECRIDEYKIDTLFDKEEGYIGKSGFAIVEEVTVSCAGLTTKNYSGEKTTLTNDVYPNPYIMGGFTQAIVTVTLSDGSTEKVNFPV